MLIELILLHCKGGGLLVAKRNYCELARKQWCNGKFYDLLREAKMLKAKLYFSNLCGHFECIYYLGNSAPPPTPHTPQQQIPFPQHPPKKMNK